MNLSCIALYTFGIIEYEPFLRRTAIPTYDYYCEKCDETVEIMHMMSDDSSRLCESCGKQMKKQISSTFYVSSGMKPTMADRKETEHSKKVKDPERAVNMRKRAFGKEAVGDPSMKTDPRHIVKRGKTIGGQQKDIDKGEFIKAASKDPGMVKIAQEALRKKTQ